MIDVFCKYKSVRVRMCRCQFFNTLKRSFYSIHVETPSIGIDTVIKLIFKATNNFQVRVQFVNYVEISI